VPAEMYNAYAYEDGRKTYKRVYEKW
jgi:hypothetical protein